MNDKKITILINNKPFEALRPSMSGRDIKELGGGPMDYWLILVVKSADEAAGGDDKQIQDEELVDLKSGLRFRIVNPATFGLGLPPQLHADIESLREDGFSIEARRDAPGGARIYILISDYSLPRGWNKTRTMLLIIADVSYPNSKLDMFWTEVDLKLQDGRVPQAGDAIENYLGQQWRRFSWHVQQWNPAVDNLRTYLGTVDARLQQAR